MLELFENALRLPEHQRQAWVEELRGRQPHLAAELTELLAVDLALDDEFLQPPPSKGSAAPLSNSEVDQPTVPASAASTSLDRRVKVGPYRLLELLGSGGMGRVFLAQQTEPMRRQVALKVIRNSLPNAIAKARFAAERQALARLEHPNIGRILDAGTTADGYPYFALELVHGLPLNHYCDRRQLSVDRRLRLMIDVCRGVEHAHRRQIIHRDLKPSNILVQEIDGKAVPKIIDFGIAKSLAAPLTDSTLETGGVMVGTLAYMSPEAVNGSRDIDTRTDVYTLGVLLYELLAGELPIVQGDDPLAKLIRRVVEEHPDKPSSRWAGPATEGTRALAADNLSSSPRELRQRLLGDLDWVVMAAIAKEPDQRYGSASALADDLERHLLHQPVSAGPPSVAYRLAKAVRRHRAAFAAALALVAMVVGGLVLELRARARGQRLARATAEITREAERIEWQQRVAHLLPLQDLTPRLERLREGMSRIEAKMLELGSLGEAQGHYALGRGALSLGDLTSARQHLERAWALGEQRTEVAMALGLTLATLYEQRIGEISRLPDPLARGQLRLVAEVELRDAALAMLTRGEEDEPAAAELLAARRALYRQQAELALSHSRAAVAADPMLFEAHLVAARALRAQAVVAEDAGDHDRADQLLVSAEQAVQQGLVIGRSAPLGFLQLCRIGSHRLALAVRYLRPGAVEFHAAGMAACGQVRTIRPDLSAVDFEEARLWQLLADHQVWDLAEDPAAALEELAEVLADHRGSAEAVAMLGTGEALRAAYLERAGEDPRTAMTRAIERLEQAVELDPGFQFVASSLSWILAQRANYEANRGGDGTADFLRAEHYARQLIASQPEELVGYFYLSQAKVHRSEQQLDWGVDPLPALDEVDQLMDVTAEMDPQRTLVHSVRSVSRLLRGIWLLKIGADPTATLQASVVASDRFIELDPGAAYAGFNRGHALSLLAQYAVSRDLDPVGRMAAARRSYSRGLESLPRAVGPQVELAELAVTEARWDLRRGASPKSAAAVAVGHAERALELDAERADAWLAKGQAQLAVAIWQGQGRVPSGSTMQAARRSFAKALELEPTDARIQLAPARWLLASAGQDPAIYQARLPAVDSQTPARLSLAKLEQAIASCDQALRLDSSLDDARAIRGALLALSIESRSEGLRQVAAAAAANPRLAVQWAAWLAARTASAQSRARSGSLVAPTTAARR